MNRILVPVDGSRPARNALKYAVHMLKDWMAGEIHIINVQPVVLPMGDLTLLDADIIEEAQRKNASKILKSASQILVKAGIKHEQHIEIGVIASSIIHYGKTHGCDCIVMGTRGMGAVGNLVLGSISNKVIHLADVPVTLVK